MGIRAKLILCLLVVLIPLCVANSLATHLFEQELQNKTRETLTNTQKLETLRISGIIESYAEDARHLAATSQVSKLLSSIQNGVAPERLQQALATLLQNEAATTGSSITELRLLNRSGANLGQTQDFIWQPIDVKIAQRAMTKASTIFGNAFLTATDQQRVGIVSPIVSAKGEIVGALMLEAPLDPITHIISMHEQTGLTTEALLAQSNESGDAQLITKLRFDRKSAFAKVISESSNLPTALALTSTDSSFLEAEDYRGIMSLASIQTIPKTNWGLVVKIDKAEAYAPLHALKNVLAVAAAITLLLVILGYALCLLPVAHRLKRTAHVADKIKQGDLTVRVHDYTNDEIGNMARTIDNLAQQLQQDHHARALVEDQLRHQATHDELTGLLNRKYVNKLIDDLSVDMAIAHTIMFLDLDGFKAVNDFYGHAAGDEVLQTVAQRLINAIPANATLARWGGDEFIIVLPDTDYISADIFSSCIHAAFETSIPTKEGNHEISTSIGIATSNPGKSLREALVEADSSMYEEKSKRSSNRSITAITTKTLEQAIKDERIELWYEPIIKVCASGRESLYGAEVKIRIRTTEGGIVLPEELLNTIENTSIAASLYEHVLASATTSCMRWINSSIVPSNFQLHLALHESLLLNEHFIERMNTLFNKKEKALPTRMTFMVDSKTQQEFHNSISCIPAGVSKAVNSSSIFKATAKCRIREQAVVSDIIGRAPDASFETQEILGEYNTLRQLPCVSGITNRQSLATLTPLGYELFQGELFDRPLRAVDFISRWGTPSEDPLVQLSNTSFKLKLTG